MNQSHPVEAAWRRFRGSEHMELMRQSFAAVTSFLNFVGLKRLPPEVVLPGAVPYNLVPIRQGRSPFAPRNDVVATADELIANTIHVWAAYRESKTIYRVEQHLATCFSHTPWPDDAPAEALLLPSRCTILEVASDRGPTYFAGVYDLATAAEASGRLELRLSALATDDRPLYDSSGAVVEDFNKLAIDKWLPACILRLSGGDLAACLQDASRVARQYGAASYVTGGWRNPITACMINILLYLAGEPDLVRLTHPGEEPLKESLRRRDPERFKDLREPAVHAVGAAFTRAIERWEVEHASELSEPTGKTVRPHFRRAHPHKYWTGEGRKIPRYRYLLPISVKGGKLVEEPDHARETAVR